jgi:signal peptidase I
MTLPEDNDVATVAAGDEVAVKAKPAGEAETWKEVAKTIFYALLIAMGIRTFLFQPFTIPSGSMEDTLMIGDFILVSKYSYGYSRFSLPFWGNPDFDGRVLGSAPERGDVVVFKLPRDNSTDYIKRVIGLPGDRIQVIDGVLQINGEPVKRERVADLVLEDLRGGRPIPKYLETLPNGVSHYILEEDGDHGPRDNTAVYTVPAGHYFMMGDNRDNSQDSRYLELVGPVPEDNLIGPAQIIFFSHDDSAEWWEIWQWPFSIRYGRLLNTID